jgi:hypothetical protein
MLWSLPMTTMCGVFGTSLARASCALFHERSLVYPKSAGTKAGNLPCATREAMNGPMGWARVSRDNTMTGRERRSGAGLGHTGIEIDPFHCRVLRQLVLGGVGDGFHHLPLLGRQCCLPLRGERIDEHDAGYITGVLASVEPRDQATIGMANQDIGARLAGGPQEGMQVPDCIVCCGWLRDRSAATRRQVVAHGCARPVIGAHPREPCDCTKHGELGMRLVADPHICC